MSPTGRKGFTRQARVITASEARAKTPDVGGSPKINFFERPVAEAQDGDRVAVRPEHLRSGH